MIVPQDPTDVFVVTACYGKQSFDNPQLAHRRKREMAKKHKGKDRRAKRAGDSVYRCRVCNKWHIGSSRR